jgi:hypothetical protein
VLVADSNAAEVRLKCSLRIGDQHSLTAAAAHTGAEQAQWGPSTRQFIAMEPRGGAMQVDVLLPDGKSIGRVDVDISSLPMRPAKGAYSRAHWLKLRAPPVLSDSASSGFGGRSSSRSGSSSRSKAGSKKSKGAMKQPNPARDPKTGVAGSGTENSFFGGIFGATNATATVPARTVVETEPSSESDSDESDSEYDDASTMNGETDDDEYVGEILVDGFVDEGCGPTACIGRKTPLGELSLEILSMRGVTPEGQKTASPACLLECGGSWAHLPAASGRHPPAWRRDRGVRFEHNRTRPTRLPDDPGTTLATRLGGCFHAGAVGRPFGRRGWVWQRYVCISQILTHCLPYMTDTFLLQS